MVQILDIKFNLMIMLDEHFDLEPGVQFAKGCWC